MHVRFRLLVPCCLAAAAVAAATAVSAAAVPTASTVTARVPAATARGLELIVAGGVPGTLALVRERGAVAQVTAGVAQRGNDSPLVPDQPFRVGSISKSFVAVLALQLVEQGRLRLDDTVERWLPGLLTRGDEIDVRQLLQHTSGLADDARLLEPLLGDPGHAFAPFEVARAAARLPLLFEPGAGWSYANANYVLLGLIVERAARRPLAALVDERIAEPLGLRHTFFPTGPELPPPAAHGYLPPANSVVPGRGYRDVSATNPSWTWAAGALVSSAADVSRFYRALLAGRLVSARSLAVMSTARPTAEGLGYGLGLLRVETPCGPAYGHDGEIFGYTSLALTRGRGERTVVLLANASHPGGGRSILGAFLALAADALCNNGRSGR